MTRSNRDNNKEWRILLQKTYSVYSVCYVFIFVVYSFLILTLSSSSGLLFFRLFLESNLGCPLQQLQLSVLIFFTCILNVIYTRFIWYVRLSIDVLTYSVLMIYCFSISLVLIMTIISYSQCFGPSFALIS